MGLELVRSPLRVWLFVPLQVSLPVYLPFPSPAPDLASGVSTVPPPPVQGFSQRPQVGDSASSLSEACESGRGACVLWSLSACLTLLGRG